MKPPTEPGSYWVRQDFTRRDTMEHTPGAVEAVHVRLLQPRGKKPPELYACGNGWKAKLTEIKEGWLWEKIEPPTFPDPTRNIGGSILAAAGHDTYDVVELPGGCSGRVVADRHFDTHRLMFKDVRGGVERDIASHSNGYSCKSLLDKMKAADDEATLKQYDYIMNCGGRSMRRDSFIELLRLIKEKPKSATSTVGFGIIEMIVVLAVILVICAIAIPEMNGGMRARAEAEHRAKIELIKEALREFEQEKQLKVEKP